MITRDLWKLSHPDAPMAASYGPEERCEAWRSHGPRASDSYILEPEPHCACCGASFVPAETECLTTWANGQTRCARHHDRNPCAVEGCRRTTSADGRFEVDGWLCGTHWKMACPPRSAARRVYHRFFRIGKRHGWDQALRARFWRVWARLVGVARTRAAGGHLDEAEIKRLFGWDEESS